MLIALKRERASSKIVGCDGVEILVEMPHLGAEVAASVGEATATRVRAVVPAKSGKAGGAGKSAGEKWRVRNSGHGWERRRDGMQRALGAQPRE